MTPPAWPREIDAGDGVVLRLPDPEDAEATARAINDSLDELRPWMAWAQAPTTIDQQAVRLAVGAEAVAAGGEPLFTLVVDGEVAGGVGVHDRSDDPRTREIGYWRATAAAGRGVVTRAVLALVDELAARGFERVVITCDEANVRSAAVAERAGFTHASTEDDPGRENPSSSLRTMRWERRIGPASEPASVASER
jgi:RimJ/RimL family protein N-acetyltransferase